MQMAAPESVSSVVTRGGVEGALRVAARQERSKTVLAGRAMLWTALLIIGGLTLVPIVRFAALELETWALLQADKFGASIAVRPSQCRVRDSQNSAKAHTRSTSAGSPHCPFCAWTCGWPSLVRAAEARGDS